MLRKVRGTIGTRSPGIGGGPHSGPDDPTAQSGDWRRRRDGVRLESGRYGRTSTRSSQRFVISGCTVQAVRSLVESVQQCLRRVVALPGVHAEARYRAVKEWTTAADVFEKLVPLYSVTVACCCISLSLCCKSKNQTIPDVLRLRWLDTSRSCFGGGVVTLALFALLLAP